MRQIALVAQQGGCVGGSGTSSISWDVAESYIWMVGQVSGYQPKLTCGAFVAACGGEGGMLLEVSQKLENVRAGCAVLSTPGSVLRKCLKICLSVGNHLNQGTSFGRAQGIALPEALLKFEELRGCCVPEESGNGSSAQQEVEGQGGFSLLDFVARTLVVKAKGKPDVVRLRAEVAELIPIFRAASTVNLLEEQRV